MITATVRTAVVHAAKSPRNLPLILDPSALAEVAGRLWQDGLPAVEEDLARAGGPVADALRRALARAAQLLARAESEAELRDALVLRLTGVPELASAVASFRATSPGPGPRGGWPMPDEPAPGLVRVLDGPEGDAPRCVWSPGGHWLASVGSGFGAGERNAVRLWNTRTWRPGPVLDHGAGVPNRIDDCVLSPSGEWLSTRAAGAVWTWDADSGELRGMAEGRPAAVQDRPRVPHRLDGGERFVSAPDRSWLAAEAGPGRSRTRVWDTVTGAVRATFECGLGPVHAVAPDGSWIAVTLEETRTVLLDVAGGRPDPIPVGGHGSPVTSYAVSPDGARLAAGCEDGTVWIWDLAAGAAGRRPDPRRAPWSSCAAAPDGSWLATTGDDWQDGRVAIWDVATGHRRSVLGSGGYGPCAVAPDGSWLAAARGEEVSIWDVPAGRLRHRVPCPVRPGETLLSAATNHVLDLAAGDDGTWLAAACEDGTVRLLDVSTGQARDILDHPAVTGRMLRCVVVPDAGRLVFGGVGGTVVHDLSRGTSREAGGGRLLDVSPDGARCASGQGRDIDVRATATGETLYTLRGHTGPVKTCRWSPDGSRLASAGDRTVRVWTAAGGEIEATIRLYADPTDCCWLPDGRTVAVTGRQGLHLFDLPDAASA